jgi:hypothetical protein
MRASIIYAYLLLAYITWVTGRRVHALLVTRRSRRWRAIVGLVGLSFGWGPASDGSIAGYVLVAAGASALVSLAGDAWGMIEDARMRRVHHQGGRWAGATSRSPCALRRTGRRGVAVSSPGRPAAAGRRCPRR